MIYNMHKKNSGEILTSEQYKKLSFIDKMQVILFYKYSINQIIKL